jgi:hypothetical protein
VAHAEDESGCPAFPPSQLARSATLDLNQLGHRNGGRVTKQDVPTLITSPLQHLA